MLHGVLGGVITLYGVVGGVGPTCASFTLRPLADWKL